MPRAMRDTPIAMPIGIAVAHAARNAENTRNIDQPKCSASGASVSCPSADSYRRVATISGVGRNNGGTHPRWLASHHSTTITTMVTTLIAVLRPSPGVANLEVFSPALLRRGSSAMVIGGGCGRGAGAAVLDHRQHFLAHTDEVRRRLDRARVSPGDVAATELELVFVGDASRPRRHDD